MAHQFIYAPINPIRLMQQISFDSRYNSLPFDFQQPLLCYSQKYQTDDIVKLQVLSDWVPALKVMDSQTSLPVATIAPSTPVTSITGETYTCYEFEIDWSSIGPGHFYLKLTYTDDTPTLQSWLSDDIYVQTLWANTLLFEYCNSVNMFTAIFSTGIIFNLRVEGIIAKYTPEFEDVIYNDQLHNVTKLNAIPYRSSILFVPGADNAQGIPNFMGDRVNWAMSCDQILIDGIYYQNSSGSKWDVKRTPDDGTQNIGIQIPIVEVNNQFLLSLKTGTAPPQGFTIVELVNDNLAKAADFSVSGVFKKFSLIKNITVNNYGPAFSLKVGITSGGSELGVYSIPVPVTPFAFNESINIALLSAQTLYFGGLTAGGANCDILIDYCQYDAAPSGPAVDPVPGAFNNNVIYMWEADLDTDFARDWDQSTGLGKVDTPFYGCALCDGRNGLVDRGGSVAVGYQYLPAVFPNPAGDYNALGVAAFNSRGQFEPPYSAGPPATIPYSFRLTLEQITPHSHPISTTSSASSSNDSADPIRGTLQGQPNKRGGSGTYPPNESALWPPGTTYGPGGDGINDAQTIGLAGGIQDGNPWGAPVDLRMFSVVTVFFKKLVA
jgi:hypothetical protein